MRRSCVLLSVLILTSSIVKAQRVGINGDGSIPDTSAMLDVKSATKGLLIPRVALTATNLASPVSLPATSLLVYNTVATKDPYGVVPGFYFWNGNAWEKLSTNTWSLNGNAGTDATTNFIGTTDDQALVFKVRNTFSGLINQTHGNTSFGFSAFNNTSNGTANSVFGSAALPANTTGADNSAFGQQALVVNTSGSDNTAIGNIALAQNTTGINNTAVGSRSLVLNGTGSNNTAVGYLADVSFPNLTNATAIGYNAKVNQSNSMVLGDKVNVGIGTSLPNTSSLLDLTSTSKGLLIPRMSTTERNAISSPATGLLVYDNSLNKFYYHDGSAWTEVGGSSAANAWSLTGNSGTSPSNFIGTNDNQPLIFKVNSTPAGRISPDISANHFFGFVSGNSVTTGARNTGTGWHTLTFTTEGSDNTASGWSSLELNTTGTANTATGSSSLSSNTEGSFNTATGSGTLSNNTTGSFNTATGSSSLNANSTGGENTADGYFALHANTTGVANTATGSSSLAMNTTGNSNTAVGRTALSKNNGDGNTAVGAGALESNTTGAFNTGIGDQTLGVNATGNFNTAIGNSALAQNNGSNNTATGSEALEFNSSGSANTAHGKDALKNNQTGDNNVAIGYQALQLNEAADNTAVGSNSLKNNQNGTFNTAVGSSSLMANTGSSNTAVGFNSLKNNTTGLGNTAHGTAALASNIDGQFNTAVGDGSLVSSNAQLNVAVGYSALHENTDGGANTAIGSNALLGNITGNGNTALGLNADVAAGDLNNATAIGAGAVVDASNKVRIGNNSVTVIEGAVGFTTPSDGRFKFNVRENVRGLDFILRLRPVTYQLDTRMLNDHTSGRVVDNVVQASYNEANALRRTGFIAQEVEAAAKEAAFDFSGINKPKSATDHYSLSYESFVVPLVKAVQEQESIIKKQDEEIKKLKAQMEGLIKTVEKISSNK